MFPTKTHIATLLIVAVGLFVAGAGALSRENVAAKEAPAAAKPGTEPQAAKERDATTYAGRVLDPEGKPVAGAKLYLLYYTPKALPVPVRATSGEDGRFRFTVAHADLDTSYANEPWKGATVVAAAAGFGLAAPDAGTGAASNPSDLTLRLVKDDVPLTGRVLDLQGKSIAGVRLSVQGLHWSREGDLTPFLQDLKEKKVYFPALRQRLAGFEGTWIGRDAGTLFPAVTTDAEGRFRINGVGRERLVELCLEAPTVATRNLSVTTRPGPAISVGGLWKAGDADGAMIVHGTGADHVVAPCKPVVGVVRDKDTGKPIPGAVVTGSQRAGGRTAYQTEPRAVADHEGRYVLTGLPKGDGNVLRAVPPEGQPYLITLHRVGDSPGLDPITVDIALKRGVWINGKVIDKATGRPVPAHVEYAVFADNPNRTEVPDLSVDNDTQTRPDGTFRLVGLPGRGLIGARGHDDRYRMAVGADKIKGTDENGLFQTYPRVLLAGNFHTLVEVNPAKGADALECEVALDPGRALTGTVLGPKGKPLAGALACGLTATGTWESQPLKGAEFTLTGLEKGRPRVLQFVHKGKGLAGFLVVKGDEGKPLSVRLEPSGVLTGRLVTPEGNPVTDGEIAGLKEADTALGNFPRDVRLAKDG